MRYLFITLVAACCIFSFGCHKTNLAKKTNDTSICGMYAGQISYYDADNGYLLADTTYLDTLNIINVANGDSCRGTYLHTLGVNIETGYGNYTNYDVSEAHGEYHYYLYYYPAGDSIIQGNGAKSGVQYFRFSGKKI